MAVASVPEAYRQAEQIAVEYGGYVANSQFRYEGERAVATVSVRVPADSRTYHAALDRLRGLTDHLLDEKGEVQDVTEEHVDIEARLRNLRATEQRLFLLYERAQRLDEIYSVQREITAVRGQIEQAEGRQRAIERRSAMATITLNLREVVPPPAPPPARAPVWSPEAVVAEAVAPMGKVVQRLATAAIWLVLWLPFYGLPLLVLWLLRGRLRTLAR
jgi:hypothetical protein